MDVKLYVNTAKYPSNEEYTTYTLHKYSKIFFISSHIDHFLSELKKLKGFELVNKHNMLTLAFNIGYNITRDFDEDAYQNQLNCYNLTESQMLKKFHDDLLSEFDVTDNPKAELLYSKAWELGHSSGYSEVYSYFSDLVDLIR